MNDTDGLIKITYPVESDSWDGTSGEDIWLQLVTALPPHRAIAEVESIPFSTRTLSYGDKILLEYRESEKAGHVRFHRGARRAFDVSDLHREKIPTHPGCSSA